MNHETAIQTQHGTQTGPVVSNLLQRKCGCGQHTTARHKCDECSKQQISLRRSTGSSYDGTHVTEAPPIVHDVLSSPAQSLDASARAFFEPRFGHDFSRVRVHTDPRAAESAVSVNALAYTVGRDLVFAAGQYSPASSAGRSLLAHELTHVVQNSNAGAGSAHVGASEGAAELEAERVANSFASDQGPGGIHERVISTNQIFRYRDPKSFNFGLLDTSTLKESKFTDSKTQPWIEQVDVKYTSTKLDANGDLAPSGEFEATYNANAAALPSFKAAILGGSIVHGLTHTGNFTVTRIEGAGYNDVPFSPAEGEGPLLKYSKKLTASMHYAVFFFRGEALHGGALDIGSHGCVHIAITPELRQLNYHSVVGRTKVNVSYDATALNELCCARMKLRGVTKKGGLQNPCNTTDPKTCP